MEGGIMGVTALLTTCGLVAGGLWCMNKIYRYFVPSQSVEPIKEELAKEEPAKEEPKKELGEEETIITN